MHARTTPATGRTVDLETVWAELHAPVERFVGRHVADPHAAEDVVAEVLLRIHENLDSLDDHQRVIAWVFRIARNAITDHQRRCGRRRERLAGELVDVLAGGEAADAWIDDPDAALSELASCVRPLVELLPTGHRRALELVDLDGRTQAEAARIEGMSLSGMKSRVQRGRRQFAALVRSCCEVTTDGRGELVDFRARDGGCDCGGDDSVHAPR